MGIALLVGRSSATAAVTGGPGWGLRTVAPAIRPSPASAPSSCTAPAHTPAGPGTASTRQRSTRRRPANLCSSAPTNHGRPGLGPAPGEDPKNDCQREDARLLAGTWRRTTPPPKATEPTTPTRPSHRHRVRGRYGDGEGLSPVDRLPGNRRAPSWHGAVPRISARCSR